MGSKGIRVCSLGLFVIVLFFSTACDETATPLSGTPPPAAEATVTLQSSSFSPASVAIVRGGRVTWTNATPIAHTITPSNPVQPGVWTAQNVPTQTGFTFSHTFNTAGTYNYVCTIHAGMTGTVSVE